MTFDEALDQVRELLQQRGRVTYRSLKLRYQLNDELLAGVTDELISAERVAVDEDGKVLVWKDSLASSVQSLAFQHASLPDPRLQTLDPRLDAAERRQLTVMFCDLVGSTALSEQLDPEELRDVVRTYQETCTAVIHRYDGYVAQHLGDGLLVYFGYPAAHEDDAARAVRAGLGIIEQLQSRARQQAAGKSLPHGRGSAPLQVRIGIHTGLVVIGEIGGSAKREMLALGETPNLAARLQGLATPDTMVISAATQRLVQGLFESQDLGPQTLKGISTPMPVYRISREGVAQSRFEVAVGTGLTPLVGREEELNLLQQRWEQAKGGAGQVVLLSGEPGIGKSRLMQECKEQLEPAGVTRIEFHCSPYHQNSALYPIINHLQRLLQFGREDSPNAKLEKLQHRLNRYRFPQADTFPLLAALLSLPHPEGYPPITVSPQKQKEKTQAALVTWLVEEAERQPVYTLWEDLHWADPSTLEVLTLLLEQISTMRMCTVLTFRPEFTPPWGSRSYLTQLTLNRLERPQIEAMVEQVMGEKALPAEIVQQIAMKTDGVPLFVEELTKTVVEALGEQGAWTEAQEGKLVGAQHAAPVSLAIPATLQDSLMARLDRLGAAKEIAQLGATIGREFHYELLHAVANKDESSLQHGLKQLVEAELLYQRGLPPHVTYLFKHALIQDTAYQSLLKSKRQQLHQQIAQALEEQVLETKETQPELLAHHYTEAGLIAQAILYWQKAGERASQRSANVEAIGHLASALNLLNTLPDTPERAQQELALQIALGAPLIATKGYAAPEMERVYTRAWEICQQVGQTPQLFPVLEGLRVFYFVRAELKRTRQLSEQLLTLAQNFQEPALLVEAHMALGVTLMFLGEFALAREHSEQGIALYDPLRHRSLAFLYGQDPGVVCLSHIAWALWFLGYPSQAVEKSKEALTLAQELSHPVSLAYARSLAAALYQFRREEQKAQEWAEATLTLATEQGFPFWIASETITRGWALVQQGHAEAGIAEIQQGLAIWQTTRAEISQPHFLALLAEAYEKVGQVEEGLSSIAEALAAVDNSGERWYEAELYRLKGELLLAQAGKLRD